MGYESKIIIADRHDCTTPICGGRVYGCEIARFDLAKMGYSVYGGKRFTDLFTTPIDFDLHVNPGKENQEENYYKMDRYGEICKYTADIDGVISWLEQSELDDPYRRAKLFLNFLRVLKESVQDFNQIVLVHYGY